MTMTDFTLKYVWGTPRPHGQVVIPEVFGGNDLDNFYSPLFVYTPVAQLNMAQLARHAAQVAGTPSEKRKWDAVWKVELAAQGPHLGYSMELDAAAAARLVLQVPSQLPHPVQPHPRSRRTSPRETLFRRGVRHAWTPPPATT